MQRLLIIFLCCCFIAGSATAQHATDSVFQEAIKQYRPRPGHTQTPEDIQRMKDALSARQQAYMRGDKDPVPAATQAGPEQPIADPPPIVKGQSGMDYAHNPMFKKCRVTVSFSTASSDTSSNSDEQSHTGSGLSGDGDHEADDVPL